MAWSDHMAELAGHIETELAGRTVTVTRKAGGSLNTTTLVRAQTPSLLIDIPAVRDPITMIGESGEQIAGVEYTFDATRLSGAMIARGDTITDDATRTIVSVSVEASGAIVRARCADRAGSR